MTPEPSATDRTVDAPTLPAATAIALNATLDTKVHRLDHRTEGARLADPAHQARMREVYEHPGIVVVDNALEDGIIERLRSGLSEKTRKFKDEFNEGVGPVVAAACREANEEIARITQALFGYRLPEARDRSYRPMISADEPMHFDSYPVACGTTPLMSILNFAPDERRWHVGPSFPEICRDDRRDVIRILRGIREGKSPSVPLRTAGERGEGPLGDPERVHRIAFAPNSLWYANPKIISHQLVYGRGCMINTWLITDPACKCQKCLLERSGIAARIGPGSTGLKGRLMDVLDRFR